MHRITLSSLVDDAIRSLQGDSNRVPTFEQVRAELRDRKDLGVIKKMPGIQTTYKRLQKIRGRGDGPVNKIPAFEAFSEGVRKAGGIEAGKAVFLSLIELQTGERLKFVSR